MKFYSLLCAAIFATSGLAAASDPFVGTWVYNAEKSPKPTITYGMETLAEIDMALPGVLVKRPILRRAAWPSNLLRELQFRLKVR